MIKAKATAFNFIDQWYILSDFLPPPDYFELIYLPALLGFHIEWDGNIILGTVLKSNQFELWTGIKLFALSFLTFHQRQQIYFVFVFTGLPEAN